MERRSGLDDRLAVDPWREAARSRRYGGERRRPVRTVGRSLAGRVLTRLQLIDRVWGSDYVGDTKTLDVHVKRLRAKIEPDPTNPRFIVTVRGLGYKFEP